jgi:hypothetical protein
MQRTPFFVIASILLLGIEIRAQPPTKTEQPRNSVSNKRAPDRTPTRAQLIESANGWMYVNGEWVHPDGHKFVNNKIVRTTAKTGKMIPKPPGKLALENPRKITPSNKSMAAPSKDAEKAAAEKAAEVRRKNLTPTATPQTGTHL